ncbi:zinc finger BED domain-containing protein 4-like [Gadus chalcogrammus]|uniref:zinc finger BED domain-containing protein 4-like n=1 Tax=Gadus chalcogrammus TaxID=1042646 RepID=UPI0024C46092|nr:zinc finger BED domain-containing protein 4-like [Gadus chalcogrammus]
MVSRFLEQQQPVSSVLADDRSSWALMPKEHHVTILENLRQLLSPLNDFTDALAPEKRVTMSAVKPIMEHVIGEILLIDGANSADTKAMKQAIRGNLVARYSEKAKQMMEMCCFLDPRFKESFCANIDETKKACIGEAMKLLPPTAAPPGTEETSVLLPPTPSSAQSEGATNGEGRGSKKTLSGILKHIKPIRARQDDNIDERGPMTPEQTLRNEITLYLSMPSIDEAADPLQWWNYNQRQLPLLANVVKRFFCIPATSVPSERAFSTSREDAGSMQVPVFRAAASMISTLNRDVEGRRVPTSSIEQVLHRREPGALGSLPGRRWGAKALALHIII